MKCEWCPTTIQWAVTKLAGPRPAAYIHLIGCVNCGMIYEEYLCPNHWYEASKKTYHCDHCGHSNHEFLCEPL